jgi:predicted PP-loop superfamily ATPase
MKSARLSAVNKAKQAYVMAKTTLEQRLREQMREELSNLQTQIDIAVRYAYDSGESKADILRAMGLNTMARSMIPWTGRVSCRGCRR